MSWSPEALTPEAIQRLIRGNNRTWSLMYYDEVLEREHYQLTYLKEADFDYYNAAHTLTPQAMAELSEIEAYFRKKGIGSAVFVDPTNADWLPEALSKRGYQQVSTITECYQGFEMTEDRLRALAERPFLKINPERCQIEVIPAAPSEAFDEFMRIDGETNEIPGPICAKLRQALLTRRHPEIQLFLLLGSVDGTPACTGSIAIYQDMAFLAEGGTLDAFRRMGLHAAMLKARIQLAHRHGAKIAVFTALEEGPSNRSGEKVGFQLLFQRALYKLA